MVAYPEEERVCRKDIVVCDNRLYIGFLFFLSKAWSVFFLFCICSVFFFLSVELNEPLRWWNGFLLWNFGQIRLSVKSFNPDKRVLSPSFSLGFLICGLRVWFWFLSFFDRAQFDPERATGDRDWGMGDAWRSQFSRLVRSLPIGHWPGVDPAASGGGCQTEVWDVRERVA